MDIFIELFCFEKEVCENVIMKAATDNDKPVWQAAAWMLERKFPDSYSEHRKIEQSGGLSIAIQVNVNDPSKK
jgi:hypothetical protein